MVTRRFFQISFALAALWVIPAAPSPPRHGSGGGGGGGCIQRSISLDLHFRTNPELQVLSRQRTGRYARKAISSIPAMRTSRMAKFAERPIVHHAYTGGNWGHHNWDPYFHGGIGDRDGVEVGVGVAGISILVFVWGGYPEGWGGFYADYLCPYGSVYAPGIPRLPTFTPTPRATYRELSAARPAVAAAVPPSVADDGAQRPMRAWNITTKPGSVHPGRLSQCGAVDRPFRRGIAAESEGPRVDVAGLVCLRRVLRSATEAHAALALGEPADWAHLYAYYNNSDRYTEQLRKLEKSVTDAPKSAPGHFLPGYHYLMTGAKDEAKQHFAQAAKLTPNDKLAQHILKQLESGGAVTPPGCPPSAASEGKARAKPTEGGLQLFSHVHQPIAALRRANQQHHALGERLLLHCRIEFGRGADRRLFDLHDQHAGGCLPGRPALRLDFLDERSLNPA